LPAERRMGEVLEKRELTFVPDPSSDDWEGRLGRESKGMRESHLRKRKNPEREGGTLF